MTDFLDRVAKEAKRAEEWTKTARVTAAVATTALNPLAGPVAQQADLLPAQPISEISRDIDMDQQKQWAGYELDRREREALQNPAVAQPRDSRPGRDPKRKAHRTRER